MYEKEVEKKRMEKKGRGGVKTRTKIKQIRKVEITEPTKTKTKVYMKGEAKKQKKYSSSARKC